MTTDSDRVSVRVLVHGRVQGVWYRGWTVDTARSLGLSGWVRNRSDGTVEALFSGPVAEVREMIEACRSGPQLAKVTEIAEFPLAGGQDMFDEAGFEQRPSL